MLAFQKEIGFPIRRAGAADNGVPGSYYASHAERQAIILEPGAAVSVSEPMCANCQLFFQHLADRTGVTHYATDPGGIKIFQPAELEP